jgi:hypothetical protein
MVFTCLNPGLGTGAHPSFMGEIGKTREVWTIPWLEGDDALWHLQPRVSRMIEQVRMAHEQRLGGVLAIHWRTEETRANLEAFALTASDPESSPGMEAFYQQYGDREYGKAAAERIVPILQRLDRDMSRFASPEFFAYDPSWGRMNEATRAQWSQDLSSIRTAVGATRTKAQRVNATWLANALEFTLLLDEVGRRMEPAYVLKQQALQRRVPAEELARRSAEARAALEAAPIERLFRVYASRVRSKGELGVLSSINQRLWLQYLELRAFLAKAAEPNGQ